MIFFVSAIGLSFFSDPEACASPPFCAPALFAVPPGGTDAVCDVGVELGSSRGLIVSCSPSSLTSSLLRSCDFSYWSSRKG